MNRSRPVLAIALLGVCGAALLGWLAYEPARDVPAPAQQPSAAAAPARVAPPLPYRYAGTSTQGGEMQFLLERDGRVFAAAPGMVIDRDYRVESASEREIALVYLPLGLRQTVSMAQGSWPPRAGNADAASAAPVEKSPLPPPVERTTSKALLELAR